MRGFSLLLAAYLMLVTTGCGSVPVAEDLTQRQATQIVATLGEFGIPAAFERTVGGRSSFSVSVKRGAYSAAVAVLHKQDLPDEAKVSFSQIVAKKGFLPDSRQIENLRLDRAIAVEVAELIGGVPDVVEVRGIARVHALPPGERPSLSLVVQLKESAQVTSAELAEIINRAVPGIRPDRVFVTLRTRNTGAAGLRREGARLSGEEVLRVPLVPFLNWWHIPRDDYAGVAFAFIAAVLAAVLIGVCSGYWLSFFHHSRRRGRAVDSAARRRLAKNEPRPSRAERNNFDLTEV